MVCRGSRQFYAIVAALSVVTAVAESQPRLRSIDELMFELAAKRLKIDLPDLRGPRPGGPLLDEDAVRLRSLPTKATDEEWLKDLRDAGGEDALRLIHGLSPEERQYLRALDEEVSAAIKELGADRVTQVLRRAGVSVATWTRAYPSRRSSLVSAVEHLPALEDGSMAVQAVRKHGEYAIDVWDGFSRPIEAVLSEPALLQKLRLKDSAGAWHYLRLLDEAFADPATARQLKEGAVPAHTILREGYADRLPQGLRDSEDLHLPIHIDEVVAQAEKQNRHAAVSFLRRHRKVILATSAGVVGVGALYAAALDEGLQGPGAQLADGIQQAVREIIAVLLSPVEGVADGVAASAKRASDDVATTAEAILRILAYVLIITTLFGLFWYYRRPIRSLANRVLAGAPATDHNQPTENDVRGESQPGDRPRGETPGEEP
jgi:hypothetical protein